MCKCSKIFRFDATETPLCTQSHLLVIYLYPCLVPLRGHKYFSSFWHSYRPSCWIGLFWTVFLNVKSFARKLSKEKTIGRAIMRWNFWRLFFFSNENSDLVSKLKSLRSFSVNLKARLKHVNTPAENICQIKHREWLGKGSWRGWILTL